MEFQLLGHELKYSKGIENYNTIYKDITKYLYNMNCEFKSAFYSRFSNIDEAVAGAEFFCKAYIDEVLNYSLQCLSNNGVYEYDYNRFVDCYFARGFAPIINACQKIRDRKLLIEEELEEMKEYRSERKDSRGRVSGGGFGLDGAIKGMAQAGMMNAASGLAHSAVNLVGNAGSSIKAHNQKKNLYNSSDTVECYRHAVEGSMYMALLATINALTENTNLPIEVPSSEDENAAESIFNNIKSGYIPNEMIIEKLINVLQKNPYHDEAYLFILEKYQDEKNELESMADYFGVYIISATKHEEMVAKLSAINYYDLDEFRSAQKEYLDWAKAYGLDTDAAETAFNQINNLHMNQEKSTDGFVYTTKEDAVAAQKFIKEFLEKAQLTDANNVDALRQLITECTNSRILSKDKYIECLENALAEEDVRFRTVKGKIYDTREEANTARNDAFYLDKIFAQAFQTWDDIEKAVSDVEANVTSDLKEDALKMLSLCKSYWDQLETMRKKYSSIQFASRKEFSCAFSDVQKLHSLAVGLPIQNSSFDAWFCAFETEFYLVNGVRYPSAEAADNAYCKWVSHARAYLKYITEKNSEKKSIFSSIKNNVTGLVNKNYESDYNLLTENGTKSIPEYTKEDVAYTIDYRAQCNMNTPSKQSEIAMVSSRLSKSSAMDTAQLTIADLYQDTMPISAADINNIFRTMDENICVLENPVVKSNAAVTNK